MDKLKDCTLDNTVDLFEMGSDLIPAKLLSNYDGDTCKMAVEWRGVVGRITVRMNGYDSPEMKPAISNPNRDEIKKKALMAKEALKTYLEGITYLRFDGFDKYGRVLGTLFQTKEDPVSVNQKMIDTGYGYVYNGGTKQF
jgi:endonuclease YncB( thermonuclease family)